MFPASETIGLHLGFVVGTFEGNELELKNQGFIENHQKLVTIEVKRPIVIANWIINSIKSYKCYLIAILNKVVQKERL